MHGALPGHSRLGQVLLRHELVGNGNGEDDGCADQRDPADQRMEQKTNGQEDRHPRKVAQRDQAGTGQEFPQPVDIHQREFGARLRMLQGRADDAAEDALGDHLVEAEPRPD